MMMKKQILPVKIISIKYFNLYIELYFYFLDGLTLDEEIAIIESKGDRLNK